MRHIAVAAVMAVTLALAPLSAQGQAPPEPSAPNTADPVAPPEPVVPGPGPHTFDTSPPAATRESPANDWVYPFVLGVGAIAGVVIYNVVTTGIFFRPPGVGFRVGFDDLAMSRVYAVTAAVVGGWIANWLYEGQDRPPVPAINS